MWSVLVVQPEQHVDGRRGPGRPKLSWKKLTLILVNHIACHPLLTKFATCMAGVA